MPSRIRVRSECDRWARGAGAVLSLGHVTSMAAVSTSLTKGWRTARDESKCLFKQLSQGKEMAIEEIHGRCEKLEHLEHRRVGDASVFEMQLCQTSVSIEGDMCPDQCSAACFKDVFVWDRIRLGYTNVDAIGFTYELQDVICPRNDRDAYSTSNFQQMLQDRPPVKLMLQVTASLLQAC